MTSLELLIAITHDETSVITRISAVDFLLFQDLVPILRWFRTNSHNEENKENKSSNRTNHLKHGKWSSGHYLNLTEVSSNAYISVSGTAER